ncbi:MAG: hypothetical protein AB1730_17700 [Myxococcota bacterium]
MTPWLLTAVLCLAAPGAPVARAPESHLVLATEVLERVPLPAAPRAMELDVWSREVRVTTALAPAVARALRTSRLCPTAEVRDGVAVAHCLRGQLRAALGRGRRGPELVLSQPRGVPPDEPRAFGVAWHYPPDQFGLGGACPGTTPEGRAECLVAEGRHDEAVPLLTEALQHGNADFAALRLGDIAMAKGDLPSALSRYQAAGRRDSWGRVAAMRLCELTGCAREEAVFDSARLSEPLATEVDLRLARALVLQGEDRRAALALQRRLAARERQPACPLWPRVCVGVALAALRSEEPELQAVGLELFLGQQREVGVSRDPSLLREAAEAAAHLGAPAFAANLLATATPAVPVSRLAEHLARVTALYELAGDPVRAETVRTYARARLKRPLRVTPPTRTPPDTGLEKLAAKVAGALDAAAGAVELADALAVAGRSRASAVLGAAQVVPVGPPPDDGAVAEEAGGRDGGIEAPPAGAPIAGPTDSSAGPDAGGEAAPASTP